MKNQDGGLKCLCLTLSRVNVTLDAKISLVPTHQLIVPSTLLAPATHIRSHKVTKPRRFIRSNHWHIWAILNNVMDITTQEKQWYFLYRSVYVVLFRLYNVKTSVNNLGHNDITKNQSQRLKYYRTWSPSGTIFNMAASSEDVDVQIWKFTQILTNYSPKQCRNTPFHMTKH